MVWNFDFKFARRKAKAELTGAEAAFSSRRSLSPSHFSKRAEKARIRQVGNFANPESLRGTVFGSSETKAISESAISRLNA